MIRRPGDAVAEGPQVGTRAGSLLERAPATTIRRPAQGEPEAQGSAAPAADSPLVRFAMPVELDPDKPQMAIVLLHDGQGPMGPQAVQTFPFPVSFAVDTRLPDAAEIMAGYRAAGFEVMALIDVPRASGGFDAAAAVQAALGRVNEAVAVMEGTGDGLQGSREISAQIAALLGETGHGLVMLPAGLNTAQQLAARAGVPSVSVFRDFDGEGQDGRTMRRFLDQAAFRARQDEPVVMLGRMRADTVSALLLWGLQDRAAALQLVPISVVLRGSAP